MGDQTEGRAPQIPTDVEELVQKQRTDARRYIAWYYIPLAMVFLGAALYRWLAKGDLTGTLAFLGLAIAGAYLAWTTWQGARDSEQRLRNIVHLQGHPTDSAAWMGLLPSGDRDPRVKRIVGSVFGTAIGLFLTAGGILVYALFRPSSGVALAGGYGGLLALVGACVLWVTIWGFAGKPRVADKGVIVGVAGALLGIVYLVVANLAQSDLPAASLWATPIAVLAIIGGALLISEGRSHRNNAPDVESRPVIPSREQVEQTRAETRRIMRRSDTLNSITGPIFTLIGIYSLLYRHDYELGAVQLGLGVSAVGQAIVGRRQLHESEQMEKIHRPKEATTQSPPPSEGEG